MRNIYRSFGAPAILAGFLLSAVPGFAQHENDLHFGIADGKMAVIEPDTYEVPKIMYYDGFLWIRDQGIDGYRPLGEPLYQLKSCTWTQVSYTPGLVFGNIFGDGKPGFINLDDGTNRHIHFPVRTTSAGTYRLVTKLTNGLNQSNQPVPNSDEWTMTWVTGDTGNPDAPAYAAVDIPQLRNLPNTPPSPTANGFAGVHLQGLVVSSVFATGFCAQTEGRSAGLFFTCSETVNPGDRIGVRGHLSTVGGERWVQVTEPLTKSAGIPPVPLTLTAKSAGGMSMGKYTPATKNGAGVSTVGLLCRVAGVLKSEAGKYYVDDGSIVPNDAVSAKGLKISMSLLSSAPDLSGLVGHPVIVTGVIGADLVGSGIIPVIKPSDSVNIVVL